MPPCRSAARREAAASLPTLLMRVIGEDLLVQIEDQGAENQLLVDPTMPEAFPVWLEADNGNLRLRPDWTELH